jgi:hypothetical protein
MNTNREDRGKGAKGQRGKAKSNEKAKTDD